jgi:menaquinone-specific isochorismate synthase
MGRKISGRHQPEGDFLYPIETAYQRLLDEFENRAKVASEDKGAISNKIWRIEVSLEPVDLISWLHHQDFEEKIYWSNRDRTFEMCGIGSACLISGNEAVDYPHLFNRIDALLRSSEQNVRCFGGLAFDQNQRPDAAWRHFPKYRFAVPKLEIVRNGDRYVLALNFEINGSLDSSGQIGSLHNDILKLRLPEPLAFTAAPQVLSREDLPDLDSWLNNVKTALRLFDENELQKIVLARKSILRFGREMDPTQLLYLLAVNNFKAFHFYFQLRHNYAFLGITPELLYKRDGDEIFSEAIAGTRPRGGNDAEDNAFGDDLLNSDKDLREHRWVSDMVNGSLKPLCTSIDVLEKETLLKLSHVQHLCTQYRGALSNSTSDGEILSILHPTPAVGGIPREKSMARIAEMEPFYRGWYAGPVGWISKESAEFVVAIRSALATGPTLSLFAGSGIVKGSLPEKEWEETENKILNFTRLFSPQ